MFVDAFPEFPFQSDRMCQLPLHYALEHPQSYEVIESVLRLNTDAVKARDVNGCTPLHLFFLDFNLKKKITFNLDGLAISVLDIIYSINPSVFLMEDSQEQTVLELAIDEEINLKIIRKIQYLTRN